MYSVYVLLELKLLSCFDFIMEYSVSGCVEYSFAIRECALMIFSEILVDALDGYSNNK